MTYLYFLESTKLVLAFLGKNERVQNLLYIFFPISLLIISRQGGVCGSALDSWSGNCWFNSNPLLYKMFKVILKKFNRLTSIQKLLIISNILLTLYRAIYVSKLFWFLLPMPLVFIYIFRQTRVRAVMKLLYIDNITIKNHFKNDFYFIYVYFYWVLLFPN